MGIYEEARRARAQSDAREEAARIKKPQQMQEFLEFRATFSEVAGRSHVQPIPICGLSYYFEDEGFLKKKQVNTWRFHPLTTGWHKRVTYNGGGWSNQYSFIITPGGRMLCDPIAIIENWSPSNGITAISRIIDSPDGDYAVICSSIGYPVKDEHRKRPHLPSVAQLSDYLNHRTALIEWLGEVIGGTRP